MAQRVRYPDHIAPLVEFVEETTPERIVAATHDKLATGTTVKDMLLASALAVVRSSDLPPGHHGGPLHPLCGLHAVHHISARLPGEYAMLPVITFRALEYFGWEYAKYIGRAPVRYITRPTNPAMMLDVDDLIRKYELLERDLRMKTGEDETAAVTALADEIGRCSEFGEIPEMLARALGGGLSLEGTGEALSVGGSTLFLRSQTR